MKLGSPSLLLCGGHTVPHFNNVNRWHLLLNNKTGWDCASNDGLGGRTILQKRERGCQGSLFFFFYNQKTGKYEELGIHHPVSLHPERACVEAVRGFGKGDYPSTQVEHGPLQAELAGEDGEVRFCELKVGSLEHSRVRQKGF